MISSREVAAAGVFALVLLLLATSVEASSVCYGTTAKGRLANGCRLPAEGRNFSAYSTLGGWLGRTWAHCQVVAVVESAYSTLRASNEDWHFVYGEAGRAKGGEIKPHRTHRNGLSVDFMVPVVDDSGTSLPLPTWFGNKYGYAMEFDANGKQGRWSIDFEAMAAHIAALRVAARKAGVGIWRVIFDPRLQPRLQETTSWPAIQDLAFSRRQSWVRHDEHYHIDFSIPCKPLSAWPH